MNILFDLRKYQSNIHRGIGRYVSSLIEHIIKNDKTIDVNILLYKFLPLPPFYKNYTDSINIYYYENLHSYNFEQKIDHWFFDDVLGFLERCKDINTFFDELYPQKLLDNCNNISGIIHDFIPLVFAKDYLNDKTQQLKYLLQIESTKVVDHFFTNSECTKSDGIKYLQRDEKYFTNIYGGADTSKFTNISKNSISKNNNIICIVDGDKRKNAHNLIRAFSIAYNSGKIPKDAKLYIAPIEYKPNGFLSDIIKQSNLTDKEVIRAGFISDETLIKELSNSIASIFPSFYEGLGLPIIESYACNTASFASNLSSTKELVDSECSFNPYDINEMSNLIINIYNNNSLREKSLLFGKKLIEEKVNWDISSNKVIKKLYELKNKTDAIHKNKANINTVVFSPLPPESSRLASVSATIFGQNYNCHLFSKFDDSIYNFHNAILYNKNNFKNNFYSIDCYSSFQTKENFKNKIFVLSNSYHSIDYLSMAILENDEQNSYLFLDKENIFILLYSYLTDINKLNEIIFNSYPKIKNEINKINNFENLYSILISKNIYGIKALTELTNIKNIILENDNNKTKNIILNELEENKITDINIYKLEDININSTKINNIIIDDDKIDKNKNLTDNKIINLIFCTRTFIDSYKHNNSRAGVFFVSYNILKNLSKYKNINIKLLLTNDMLEFEKNIKKDDLLKGFELITDADKNKFNNILSQTDIFFSCYYDTSETIKKYTNIQIFQILHDTMPVTFNQYFPMYNANTKQYQKSSYMQMLDDLNRDTFYLCTSKKTKKDFLSYFSSKIDENKMFITYWAANDNFYQNKDEKQLENILKKYNVSNEINKKSKFIFSLCTIEPRKNLIFTVKCFLRFIDKHNINNLYFLLGGSQWDFFMKKLEVDIEHLLSKHKNKIIRLGYIDDKDLSILYSHSLFFTYISEYEGFGIPILEAMQCGTSIITSNNSSIPEVVGNSAITIDYDNEEECIKTFEDLYFDKELREGYIEKGLERAKLFSWDKTAAKIINIFYSAIGSNKNSDV